MAAARAFVVKVTSEQLSTIAGSPLIQEILPNRQLRGRGH